MGVKAAQMAAQVASAVAAGDADEAAKLIRATAKMIDEAVSYSHVNLSVTDANSGSEDLTPEKPKRTRSVLCSIL